MSSENAVLNSRVSGIARLFRGWIIAVIAVALAAGGHQAAHSIMHGATDTMPLALLAFSTAITAPIAVGLAGRRLSMWSTVATTAVAQLVFHALYSLPYSGVSAVHDAHADHHGHQELLPVAETTALHATAAADAVMMSAHLLAALLTTAVIVHGERCLVTLVGWLLLAPTRFVLAVQPPTIVRPRLVRCIGRVWIPRPIEITHTRLTRGPPVMA